MDVTLVLTHRCNLACHYCYAGEHFRKEMEPPTLEGAVDLLFADGSDVAQLSFFGGEPFLAFDAMRRAVDAAFERARAEGRRLLVQCTTNGTLLGPEQVAFVLRTGMRVTVSLDGVREAHDLNRPRAGGGSSFEQVHCGLRALIDAGARPDVMMVITPDTAPFAFRSVSWLWSQGVTNVRANLSLGAPWSLIDRAELRAELVAVAREMLQRRLRGEAVLFQPFEAGLRTAGGATEAERAARATSAVRCGAPSSPVRGQVVVGATGNLYPCSPMVGEDRDSGPEAELRLGHLTDGPAAILGRTASQGAGCGDGRACACAAYLETGSRLIGGPQGLWFGRLCAELGAALAASLEEARAAASRAAASVVEPAPVEPEAGGVGRRTVLRRALIGAGGLALAGGATFAGLSLFATQGDLACPPVEPEVRGLMLIPPEPEPMTPGALSEPEPPPPAPRRPQGPSSGEPAPPEPPVEPMLKTDGDIGPP